MSWMIPELPGLAFNVRQRSRTSAEYNLKLDSSEMACSDEIEIFDNDGTKFIRRSCIHPLHLDFPH